MTTPQDTEAAAAISPTGTEARVCADITRRQALGLAKYGTTVEANPLPLPAWLQHAYEETLDQAIYLRRAMEEMAAPQAEQQAMPQFDSEMLDFITEHRVAVSPEFEGCWDASRYDEEADPVAVFSGSTPREAIAAVMAADRQSTKKTGCELGCTEACKAREHGCASECPALPWQPAAPQASQGTTLAPDLTEAQRHTVACMDSWAACQGLPTYSALMVAQAPAVGDRDV